MDAKFEFDEVSKDILKELANIGTGHAVSSLSQMMGCSVDIDVPKFRLLPFKDISIILREQEELFTGIKMEVDGHMEGTFLFLLSTPFTHAILSSILGEKERMIIELDEIDQSLLCEVGNIMCGSYIRAMAEVTGMDMRVSVPQLCIDMGGAILNSVLPNMLWVGDEVLMIENLFHVDGKEFSGWILFFPEMKTLEGIFQKLMG